MEIRIATLGRRPTRKHLPAEELFAAYCDRIARFCRFQAVHFPTEEKFFASPTTGLAGSRPRSHPQLVLLDSRGRSFSSVQFAAWLRDRRDQGVQNLLFAIGPADGWSPPARERAGLLLSLGPLSLPHELAAVVLAEQIYRAFTIIEGHPYHLGHAD